MKKNPSASPRYRVDRVRSATEGNHKICLVASINNNNNKSIRCYGLEKNSYYESIELNRGQTKYQQANKCEGSNDSGLENTVGTIIIIHVGNFRSCGGWMVVNKAEVAVRKM